MAKPSETKKCEYCGRGLVPLKKHCNWETRKYHKKCWFEYLMMENLKAQWAREDKEKNLNILDMDMEGLHRTTC